MVKDSLVNLEKYSSLCNDISIVRKKSGEKIDPLTAFIRDKEHLTLILVEEGEATFFLSWRENEQTNDCIAALPLKKGEFVLFLPSEPYCIKFDEATSICKRWSIV